MVRRRKDILSVADRLTRSSNNKVPSYQWIDPFPEIHGTVPEKMVYAELTRRNINFLFLNDIRFQIPEIDFDQWYQADFVLPDLKIIIEVQGAFWHSKPATIDADAYKFAIYQTTGWKPLAWWDYDILSRLQDLFFESPELVAASNLQPRYGRTGELPVQRRTKIDTSKGIRTLNERRFRAKMATTSRRKIRKATGFYAAG
jgi:very-short-patch-repair endonuclease